MSLSLHYHPYPRQEGERLSYDCTELLEFYWTKDNPGIGVQLVEALPQIFDKSMISFLQGVIYGAATNAGMQDAARKLIDILERHGSIEVEVRG